MILLKKGKGQGSLEFILIFAVIVLFIIGSIIVIQKQIINARQKKVYLQLEDFARVIVSELESAKGSPGSYSREFVIPETIEGVDYQITLVNDSEIKISVEEVNYVIFLDDNVRGSIGKGRNLIQKEGKNKSLNITITPLG